jgi:hypothetical protein
VDVSRAHDDRSQGSPSVTVLQATKDLRKVATFADHVRAQSAIHRFTSNADDLVIEGESYRPRLKPWLGKDLKERTR